MNAFSIANVAAVLVYALGSSALVSTNATWYNSLQKPSWQPPGQLFGLIWTYNFSVLIAAGLYIGTSASTDLQVQWLVFLCASVFAALLWAFLFFGEGHNLQTSAYSLAAAAVLTLPLVRIAFLAQPWPLGFAMLPYQIWLGIAALLSFSYANLNS
jgi:tryptophan-rich sensory protein